MSDKLCVSLLRVVVRLIIDDVCNHEVEEVKYIVNSEYSFSKYGKSAEWLLTSFNVIERDQHHEGVGLLLYARRVY